MVNGRHGGRMRALSWVPRRHSYIAGSCRILSRQAHPVLRLPPAPPRQQERVVSSCAPPPTSSCAACRDHSCSTSSSSAAQPAVRGPRPPMAMATNPVHPPQSLSS